MFKLFKRLVIAVEKFANTDWQSIGQSNVHSMYHMQQVKEIQHTKNRIKFLKKKKDMGFTLTDDEKVFLEAHKDAN